mgnify:CR=1 FL=1
MAPTFSPSDLLSMKRHSSTKDPSSSNNAILSNDVNLPLACCAWILFSPPPRAAASRLLSTSFSTGVTKEIPRTDFVSKTEWWEETNEEAALKWSQWLDLREEKLARWVPRNDEVLLRRRIVGGTELRGKNEKLGLCCVICGHTQKKKNIAHMLHFCCMLMRYCLLVPTVPPTRCNE